MVLATVDVTDQQGHRQHLDLLQASTVETKRPNNISKFHTLIIFFLLLWHPHEFLVIWETFSI